MVKLISIAFVIFINSLQQQSCTALLVEAIGTVSSFVTIGIFLYDMQKQILGEIATNLDSLVEIREMNNKVEYYFESISNTLAELPSIINLLGDRRSLAEHYHQLRTILEEAVEYHKRIRDGDIEDFSRYEHFRNDKEAALDTHFSLINFILLKDETVSYLVSNFSTSLKRHENVCITGMSFMQLLDSLLVKLRIATAQYFTAKNLILDLLELGGPKKYNTTRKLFMRNLELGYTITAIKFKQIMTRASREFYRCDNRVYIDDERYKQPNDSSYYEIQSFQRYVLNVDSFLPMRHDCKECAAINDGRINHCKRDRKICPNTRTCRSKLAGCESLPGEVNSSWIPLTSQICLNDRNAYARYQNIITEKELSQYSCDSDKNTIYHYKRNPDMLFAARHCKWCHCICQENDYYISVVPEVASITENNIVTGARLIFEDKTLYIQIEEGKVLANGTIDRTTLSWKPVDKGLREIISWNGVREIDLTETILPIGRVLAGLMFGSDGKRIRLGVLSHEYDFRSGNLTIKLNSSYQRDVPKYARQELYLKDRDVTTRTKKPNKPDSNTNQFVKFTTTKLELDGGQTTIPFIDTQDVKPNPVIPLSGAGLFHRGQPGYGGFISLKLYTYNIVPFIDVNSNI